MAIRTFEELEVVKTPQARKKGGLAKRVGEFVAPTTTGILTGEKPLTARTGLGAALEVGSFAVPTGAILRGASLLGRAARGAKAVKEAKKVSDLERLSEGAKTFGRRLGTATRETATIGGVAGAGLGAGRALGEEEKGLTEVLGEATIGGAAGAVGGAALGFAGSIMGQSLKGLVGASRNSFNAAKARLRPEERTAAVEDVANSLELSLLEREAVIRKLRTIAGIKIIGDEKEVLRAIADEGYMPFPRGKLLGDQKMDFRGGVEHISDRIKSLSEQVTKESKSITQTTRLSDLNKAAKQSTFGDRRIEPIKVQKQIDKLLADLKKEFKTEQLSGEMVDLIRARGSQLTKSFAQQARKDKFVSDAWDKLRFAARERLDELNPNITELNSISSRLQKIRTAMKVIDGERIDVGYFSNALGRWFGVVGGGALGVASVAGGAGLITGGGLVIAGVLAQLGQRIVANLIRQFRFNPQLQEILRQGIRSDVKLLRRLTKEGDISDANLINRFAGQRKGIASASANQSAKTRSAPKNVSIGGMIARQPKVVKGGIGKKKVEPLAQEARNVELVNFNKAVKKFEQTGTADVITGKDFGISVKDEGDFISVRFGSNKLTPIGELPSGERNFATKEEAFDFVKQIQSRLSQPKLSTESPLLVEARKYKSAAVQRGFGKKKVDRFGFATAGLMRKTAQQNEQTLKKRVSSLLGVPVKTRIKTAKSLLDKVKRYQIKGKNPNEIADVLGSKAIFGTQKEVQAGLEKIRKNFTIVDEENFFRKPTSVGYRGLNIQIRLNDGSLAEIQLHTRKSAIIQMRLHPLYKKYGDNPPERIVEEMKAIAREDLAGFALKQTRETGGVTVGTKGLIAKNTPKTGYAVAVSKRFERKIPKNKIIKRDVENYLLGNSTEFQKEGMHLGMWEEKGEIFFDVSEVFSSKNRAIQAGRARKQLGITDLEAINRGDFDNATIRF